MRQTISGLVAAIAVVAASAVPASACGLFDSGCGQSYVAAPVYSGCNCGGAAYERLPDPAYQYGVQSYPAVHQYYYADQGPTFTGPGDFAPHPTYQEGALPYYGGYHAHRHYHSWHAHSGYWGHPGMRYGYEHHGYEHRGYEHHGYEHHGYSMRYGYHGMPYHGMPHQYGYGQHTRRYY
jgi:hypothetical protein